LSVFPIRVTDKNRYAVSGLTASDFQLKDTDRITTSLYFAPGADRVALVFALDQSGSLREIISQQRDAALALFERFGKASRVAVIRFAERPRTVVSFAAKDSEAARAAFHFSPATNSHTAIFDAAAAAVHSFDDAVRDPAERRIVILISDGLDNASTTKPSSVIADAQDKNVSFYTIQIPLFEPRAGHLEVRRAASGFRELAAKTGGKYFLVGDARTALEPAKNQDLGPIFRAIEEDLKSQYLVGFYVAESAHDGQSHRVSINIARPGLTFSVAQHGNAKTHYFFVRLNPRTTLKSPE
jgi:Ca-activated chloride channel family protein